jgi:V/A-type H+-transporting ATPase subunit B
VLASVVGEDGLSASDREYLTFGDRFERGVINQAQHRSLAQSLDAGWDALRGLPRTELHRLSDAQIRAHLAG